MLKFMLVFAVIACVNAFTFQDLSREEWKAFRLKHKKYYEDELEEQFRYEVFNKNRLFIAKHNQRYAQGDVSYRLGINQFADMTHTEFLQSMTGLDNSLSENHKTESVTFIPPANIRAPSKVDWRKKGAVTPVKYQGQCRSCWAFSATGALEGQHFLKRGKLVSLSEQNLVDCSTAKYYNYGCYGGMPDRAFQYIKDNHGIDTEESYPYKGVNSDCRFDPRHVGATLTNTAYLPASEKNLQDAVAVVGPISVTMDAWHQTFQFYKSGVFDEPSCATNNSNHAVLVVGYGSSDNRDYWLVKNSYGTSWGMEGYIMMSRNKGNQCGIASAATFPLV